MAFSNLKAEMTRSGVPVRDIAEFASVTEGTVYNWLNGKTVPDIETAIKIQERFFASCDLKYLFSK